MSCNAKKDSNGTWRIQYRWTDWTGTKKKSQKRGFKTKKEAEEWYAHFIMQQTSDPTMTLNDFWEIYKADMEKRLRKTTMKQKEYVMKDKVLPYFGNTPINAITAPMIRKWQGEMMETRNSLTKALQQMGFDKAKSWNENETVAWQKREREYMTELCREQGIEIDVLGISRDNLTLPEYKAAMRKVEGLEDQADKIKENNMEQRHENIQLTVEARKLNADVEQLKERAVELAGQIELLETKEKVQQDRIDKYGIRADGIDKISKEVSAEVKNVKAAATPIKSIFGGEEYVKVKKSEWSQIMATFEKALTRNKLLDKYEAKIAELEKTVDYLKTRMEKFTNRIKEMKKFLTEKNLLHEFLNLMRKPEQETMQDRIDRKNAEVRVRNEQTDRDGRRKRGIYEHNI